MEKTASREGACDKGHKNEMMAWAQAIRDGLPETVPFGDSVIATRAIFAVLQSLWSGQVVSLFDD